MGTTPRRMKDFLPHVMREMGIKPANKLEAVKQAWKRVAGSMADRAHVSTLKNGVLTLSVESPTLSYEIEAVRQTDWVPKLQALLPDRSVTRLKCVIA